MDNVEKDICYLVRAQNIDFILERNLSRTMMEYCVGSWVWKTLLPLQLRIKWEKHV